jgi:hypothetical protein
MNRVERNREERSAAERRVMRRVKRSKEVR